MGLFDKLLRKKRAQATNNNTKGLNKPRGEYADASSIPEADKAFYQPDDYYTNYSHKDTFMQQRVIIFDERKQYSYPSARGLYVGEILLLQYCTYGNYPKPSSGYPGFWWFKYGIRDVGKALSSLEQRGYIQWATKTSSLSGCKVKELKLILENAGLKTTGKKVDLISRITENLSEEELIIPDYTPKYELTNLGKTELEQNSYVPYMHNHRHATVESSIGFEFNVWTVNKLFPDGNAVNWKNVVGKIEKEHFGVDMANHLDDEKEVLDAALIREYIKSQNDFIKSEIKSKGDGYVEESRGIDYKIIGKDKDAIVQFLISIGKGFDAPALYRESSILFRKYGMIDEELFVIDSALKNLPKENLYRKELLDRKAQINNSNET